MTTIDQTDLLNRLDLVEAETNPQNAEEQLFDILRPLLEEEGYRLEHTGGPQDYGIDFLGMREHDEYGLPTRLGIQYKHYKTRLGTDAVQQVIGASITNDLERMLLLSRSGFSLAARQVIERALPTAVELIDLDFLRSWIVRLGTPKPVEPPPKALIAISEFGATLARIIARNPNELDHIEWRDLERLVELVFSKLGFTTTLTPPAKDGGRDVILNFQVSQENRSFIVEVKHWRSRQKVGKGYVTDFVRVVASEARTGGLFVASYGYTNTAFETLTEVERHLLHSGDKSKVVALCRTFVRAEAGLFTAPEDLTELITTDTLQTF